MGQVNDHRDAPDVDGFCPSCGEPYVDGKIKHTDECPFAGDDRLPEDANAIK